MTNLNTALWTKNPALVQLIGLCPLLAVSNSVAVALLLAMCTIAVLVIAMSLIALCRTSIDQEVRLPIFVLLIAGCTTLVEIVLQLAVYEFYLVIGLFVPLITTNCLLLARAESYASQNTLLASIKDASYMGIGFAWVLVVLGAVRELLGQGTLFVDLADVLPVWPASWVVQIDSVAVPLFALPPGGFIVFGLLLVVYNLIMVKNQPSTTNIKQQGTDYAPHRANTLS